MQTSTPDPSSVAHASTAIDHSRPRAGPADQVTNERLAESLEHLTEGVLIMDRQGWFVYANAAAEAILGVERGRITERSCLDEGLLDLALNGKPYSEDEHPFLRVQRTGTALRNAELTVRRVNGTRMLVSVNATPLRDAAGGFDGVVAVFSDITARKRMEQAAARLRESEAAHRRSDETARLLRAQLTIYRQESLSGLLAATVEAIRRLGVAARVGCLLRDPGLDAWYLTTLLDADGQATNLDPLGVSSGPLPFTIPATAAPRPLADVMGAAWGSEASGRVERELGTTSALCLPVPGAEEPRAVLIALLPDDSQAVLIGGVLAHAASGAARHLAVEGAAVADTVLPASVFAERAAGEIQRAERYGRPLSVVVFETDRLDELAQLGRELGPALRRWDLLGRVSAERPAIAAILPETSRAGARGLIDRLSRDLLGVRTGAASYPDDGSGFARLIDVAGGRAVRLHGPAVERWNMPADSGRVWRRGAPSGPDAYVVRCPICLTPYSRRVQGTTDARALEQAWAAARDALQAGCPCHPDEMVV